MACISYNTITLRNYLNRRHSQRSPQYLAAQFSFAKFSALYNVTRLNCDSPYVVQPLRDSPRFKSTRFFTTVFNSATSANAVSGAVTSIAVVLPKPEAPPGLTINRSKSLPESVTGVKMPATGKFFREKSSSLSSSITKRLSSLKDNQEDDSDKFSSKNLTQINLSGLKVIVKSKDDKDDDNSQKMDFKGRISFFSRSNCRECQVFKAEVANSRPSDEDENREELFLWS